MLYPNALSPIRVGGFVFKNRLVIAPSAFASIDSSEPCPTDESMALFMSRAKTGAGHVTVTGFSVVPEFESRWNLGLKRTRDRLSTMVESIHYHGAKASMEFVSAFFGAYGVSDGAPGIYGIVAREIPVDEMMRYRDRYVENALILKKLGFDGLFLHFGHGMPLAQFLSPYTNKRTDQYGGSFENRTRYLLDILSSIREAVGSSMFIEARVSGSEFQAGGIDLDEGIRIGEALSPYLDILQVSAGVHTPDWMTFTHPSGFRPRLPNVHLARAFKESGRIKCKISTLGAIRNLQDADDLIASGTADFTAMARSLIADPEMISKCMDGRIDDVVPCIQCMRCHDSGIYGEHFQCSVNPKAGMEFWIGSMESPPSGSRKVAVIGGGPAGMKAALTAAERGHSVTLFEASDALGGLMRYAEHVSFKYPHARYIRFLVDQVGKSSVSVKLNTRATPDMIKAEGYDAVISAVGSEPVIPAIPGVEHAVAAIDAHGDEGSLGEVIAIIGGGQVGVELALHLDIAGKKATVLEMQREIAPDASKTQRDELFVELRNSGVRVLNFAKCTAIEPGKVFFEHNGVEKSIDADSIVFAVGMKSRSAERDSFMGAADVFFSVGDCNAPRILEWATKEGYSAGVCV